MQIKTWFYLHNIEEERRPAEKEIKALLQAVTVIEILQSSAVGEYMVGGARIAGGRYVTITIIYQDT